MQEKTEFRLSVSKAKVYNHCKAQYNFNYNLKLPKKERDYHVLGKFVHGVLEMFHKLLMAGDSRPYNNIMTECWKACLNSGEYNSLTPESKKEAREIISAYITKITNEKANNSLPMFLSAEMAFSIEIAPSLVLNGAIDRIQEDLDNVIHVCDYKTTKNKKYLKNDWFQLLTYAYIILMDNPTLEKVRGSYILMRHKFEYITKEFKRDEILTVKDTYIKYADEIAQEQLWRPSPGRLCEWCDFYEEHCEDGRAEIRRLKGTQFNGQVGW